MVHRDFFFDGVFNHTHTNDHVFEHTVKHLLSHCLAGKNSTFICHGQTGTGKTYTVTGMQNLVARALFPDEQERKKGEPHQRRIKKICVEFFELFGKECRDLLADRKRVYLRADSDRRVHARGAVKAEARSLSELLDILKKGNALRARESTERNEQSSRSHSIVRLSLHHDDDHRHHQEQDSQKAADGIISTLSLGRITL